MRESLVDRKVIARTHSEREFSLSAWSTAMNSTSGCAGVRAAGAKRRTGLFKRFERDEAGRTIVHYEERAGDGSTVEKAVRTCALIGADGALSAVARQCLPGADRLPYVFAYHEIVRSPPPEANFDGTRCDVYYRGWGSAGFLWLGVPARRHHQRRYRFRPQGIFAARFRGRVCGMPRGLEIPRPSVARARRSRCIRCQRWDDGHSVLLAGDAAGVVAPASAKKSTTP